MHKKIQRFSSGNKNLSINFVIELMPYFLLNCFHDPPNHFCANTQSVPTTAILVVGFEWNTAPLSIWQIRKYYVGPRFEAFQYTHV